MNDFHLETSTTFESFQNQLLKLQPLNCASGWIYRGQAWSEGLEPSLERAFEKWGIPHDRRFHLEQELIRDFRRGYRGQDLAQVSRDKCYCLALMRHHGAPTRLLDWTYSPYVAAKFALDKIKKHKAAIWCLNTAWLNQAVRDVAPKKDIARWNTKRDCESFERLFMPKHQPRKFVYSANPDQLNERLGIQQGLFLCQGDVGSSFVENIRAMRGAKKSIVKMKLKLKGDDLYRFAEALLRMNVGSGSLFPGLDGYAQSFNERFVLYRRRFQ